MGPDARSVHHSYVWLGSLKLAVILIFSIGVSVLGSLPGVFAEVMAGDAPLWLVPALIGGSIGGCVLIVGICALVYWLAWKNLRYELGAQEITLYHGIFSKKRMHVPYQRIQSVDTRAGILQRLVGVCSLELDTAGGAANKAFVVPYLLKSDAQALRQELFARKAVILAGGTVAEDGSYLDAEGMPLAAAAAASAAPGAAAGEAPNVLDEVTGALQGARGVFDASAFAESQAPSFEAGLSNKELLLSGISDMRNVLGALVLGLLGFAATVLSLDFASDALAGFIEQQVESGLAGHALSTLMSPGLFFRMLLPFVFAFLGALVVMSALSAIGSVLSYGGFKVRRRGSRIEVERGLLQHRTQGVDIDRVQLLRVEHGWIRRKLGYCKVVVGRIDSVSKEEGQSSGASIASEGVVIHPFLKTGSLPAFLEGVIPEFACEFSEVVRPSARARGRALRRHALLYNGGFWTLVCLFACAAIGAAFLAAYSPDLLDDELRIIGMLAPLWAVLLAVMAVGAVRGAKWHRGSQLEYGLGFIRVINEGFTRKEVLLPRQKVQFSMVRANPFQARAGLATASVTTAAGVGGTAEAIWDLELEDAEAFQEHLRPRR